MTKDIVIKKIVTIEVEIKVRTNNEKHFERTLKERVRETSLDIWSGECKTGYSTSIDTKKSKLVSVRDSS